MEKSESRRRILDLKGVKIDLDAPEKLSALQIRELNKLIDYELARVGIEIKYSETEEQTNLRTR
jgi:hypothetical protein